MGERIDEGLIWLEELDNCAFSVFALFFAWLCDWLERLENRAKSLPLYPSLGRRLKRNVG